ncbi:hypothetical protein FS749_006680 [Ceratobasidium sp. UAMH 11750]|nr:hypothetical protein FS749_006680 [Ceratobasidium sp. UAMH 11750]
MPPPICFFTPWMSSYQLSDTRPHISQLSPPLVSLHTVLDSSPEPATTASGVVPGRALLDDCVPATEVVSELEALVRRYSQPVRISTEKIKPHRTFYLFYFHSVQPHPLLQTLPLPNKSVCVKSVNLVTKNRLAATRPSNQQLPTMHLSPKQIAQMMLYINYIAHRVQRPEQLEPAETRLIQEFVKEVVSRDCCPNHQQFAYQRLQHYLSRPRAHLADREATQAVQMRALQARVSHARALFQHLAPQTQVLQAKSTNETSQSITNASKPSYPALSMPTRMSYPKSRRATSKAPTSSQQGSQPSPTNRSLPRSISLTQLSPVTQRHQGRHPHTSHLAVTQATTSKSTLQAQRASKGTSRTSETHPGSLAHLPAAMAQTIKLARTRHRLRREHERRTQERQGRSSGNAPTTLELDSTPSPSELMEDDEEDRVALEAGLNGRDPKRGRKKKPVARDVHGNERQVLTSAKLHLFAYSIVEGAYQSRGLVARWSCSVYELTFGQEFPDLVFEAPSPDTIQVMVNALPTYRGRVKDALRPLPPFRMGFKQPALTPEAVEHNLELFKKLHPNTFHCLEYDPPYGHYESEIVLEAIALALFASPTSVGVVFQDYFNPVPLTAVAFVLANITAILY